MGKRTDTLMAELRTWGLGLPGAHRKAPWPNHDDLAVRDKTFAYLSVPREPFQLSVKLRYTSEVALQRPHAAPTGYGLGKSGWVTFTPPEDKLPSLDELKTLVEESYRAQAPRMLVKALDAAAAP